MFGEFCTFTWVTRSGRSERIWFSRNSSRLMMVPLGKGRRKLSCATLKKVRHRSFPLKKAVQKKTFLCKVCVSVNNMQTNVKERGSFTRTPPDSVFVDILAYNVQLAWSVNNAHSGAEPGRRQATADRVCNFRVWRKAFFPWTFRGTAKLARIFFYVSFYLSPLSFAITFHDLSFAPQTSWFWHEMPTQVRVTVSDDAEGFLGMLHLARRSS